MRVFSSRLLLGLVAIGGPVIASVGAAACTLDYDQFVWREAGASSSSTSGAGGASGSSSGMSSSSSSGKGGAGVGGMGGSSASSTSGAGGTDGGTGGAGGTDGGTGGAGGTDGGTGGAGGGAPCVAGEKQCGGACVLVDDPSFGCAPQGCGPCAVPHATAKCQAGTCGVSSCDPGFKDCDGLASNGCEANLGADPKNCGACAVPCAAIETCQSGMCKPSGCPAGFGDCDNVAGCETNLLTSAQSCGFCGNACSLPNAASKCVGGTCAIASCSGTFADCDGLVANGCETDTSSSSAHCGSCAVACPSPIANGAAACVASACVAACAPGFSDCNGLIGDGCEIATATDPASCGACGNACVVVNGASGCSAGVCTVASCNSGWADCDAMASTGCETSTVSDLAHCGACNTPCAPANASPACTAGVCGIVSCLVGFANCDGKVPNGCEVNIGSDPASCGGCNNVCTLPHATSGCAGGMCTIATCDPFWSNCDAQTPDGCERDLSADVANCGACGRACSKSNVSSLDCKAGLCDSACSSGFGNCSTPAAPAGDDGCEANVSQDNSNCGGCANSCTLQGNPANPFVCDGGSRPKSTCGCSSNAACSLGGVGMASCNMGSGICSCKGTACKSGEACKSVGGNPTCTCDGTDAGCGNGQTCCEVGGCKTLTGGDPKNCGSCGHVCPGTMICANSFGQGQCQCTSGADCGPGAFCNLVGACHCSGQFLPCGAGQRCLADNSCG